jgi:SAM-dependent methyltransferase
MPQAPVIEAAESCAWCGASLEDAERLAPRLARCERCGALTTYPRPTAAELDRAYARYRPEGERRFSFLGDAILARSRATLARRVDEVSPPGPVLDVGAGEGWLLDALRARGRQAVGLERAGHRPDLRDEPVEDVEGDGDWAAVIFWHSLEHLPAPGSAVDAAARLLAEGGALFVAVPNAASLQARAFGARWLHLDLPRHVVHLSTDVLLRRLREAGFSIQRVSYARGGQVVIGWLDGLVGSLPGDLSLYQALRRPGARMVSMSPWRRLAALLAGVVLLPVAALLSLIEIALRRGATVYVEGRRERSGHGSRD